MLGKRRLTKPTLGINAATHIARVVPVGAIVDIPVSPPDGVRMIDVLLEGTPMIMFVWDLKGRSEEVADR